MEQNHVKDQVRQFIAQNFIFDGQRAPTDEASLVGSGVIDSTGILELLSYLEQHFSVKFEDRDLTAENFDSIERISSFVSAKFPGR